MNIEPWRHHLTAFLLLTAALITVYRVFVPVPSAATAVGLVLITTAVFVVFFEHRSTLTSWPQLTWSHTVLITVISGMAVVLTVYAAATVLLLADQLVRSHLLAQLLFELLQQTRFMEAIAPTGFIFLYGIAAFLMGTGFWLLYPYTPFKNKGVTGTVFFALIGLHIGAIGYLVLPILRPLIPLELGLDTVLAATWGLFFVGTYNHIQKKL